VTKGWGKIKPLKMGKFIPVLTIKSVLLFPNLDVTKKVIRKGERKVHLSDLIGWMPCEMIRDKYLWKFCIQLRNDIVHFDAIGRKPMDSPDIEHPIVMEVGKEAVGNLRSILSLSQAIENEYFQFITKLTMN